MAILRNEHKDNYTVITNAMLRNPDLSFKAKGLLCYLLSCSDNYFFNEQGIASQSTDGRASVHSGLVELEKKGYLVRKQKNVNGVFGEEEYFIYETPMCENQTTETPMCDFPSTEKPIAEKPITENQQLINNNKTNNKEINNNKRNIKVLVDVPEELYSAFEEFYLMRKNDLKKPISNKNTTKRLLEKLEKLAPNDTAKKIAIINQSTDCNWCGFFKLKDDEPKNNSTNNKDRITTPATYDINQIMKDALEIPQL